METKQEHYESMMQAITRYAPSTDLEVIQRAYEYADEKHKNQLRKSGEPYIIHPLCVAIILADLEPVQRWKMTALQTLKVLEIKVSYGLMP